jgi:O-methyltransferase involved in polyketide biosynthesis
MPFLTPPTNNADPMQPTERDYSTISPSARSLLMMKGLTNIPFARQAAEQMVYPETYRPDFDNKELLFWGRVLRFEDRYWSIDQLLADKPVKNILELSSGFSLRGLEAVIRQEVHYIDTDLPAVIAMKKNFVAALQKNEPSPIGVLEIAPLNALDAEAFGQIVGRFPEGPLAIVNEGLLMYLNEGEKQQLCRVIHQTLKERGGYWITADIYIKRPPEEGELKMNDRLSLFLDQHRVWENMFDSFDTAKEFFEKAGFVVEKEAVADQSKLTALPRVMELVTPEQLTKFANIPKPRVTWRLSPA